MQTRFMHTSDWQLGVTRQFLGADSQARWAEARFEGIRNLGRIAKEEGCEFIVVAGDIFESNQVDRRTVLKACEVMAVSFVFHGVACLPSEKAGSTVSYLSFVAPKIAMQWWATSTI